MTNIFIVEDNDKIATIIKDYMNIEGYETHIHYDGSRVVKYVKKETPDIIILDIMLPIKDGITLCKEIREFSNIPILFVTARVDEIDRIIGLEIGADDYICKPFSPRELVARVKVQLRKKTNKAKFDESNINLIEEQLVMSINNKTVELTRVEFYLFQKLFQQQGRIFNRDQLISAVYNNDRIINDRSIDNHIKKIRKKIKIIDPKMEYIQSIYGCGYKFEIIKLK